MTETALGKFIGSLGPYIPNPMPETNIKTLPMILSTGFTYFLHLHRGILFTQSAYRCGGASRSQHPEAFAFD